MNEQLSAFLDGESSRDETDAVISGLLRDEALRDSWSRQHWIRTTLRAHASETVVDMDAGFSHRVMHAIANDSHVETVSTVVPMHVATPPRVRTRRWRGVAGMGMAAAVAGIVFMSGSPLLRQGGSDTRTARTEGTMPTASGRESRVADVSSASSERGFASQGWNDRLADFSTMTPQSASMRRVVASMGSAMGVSSADARAVSTAGDAADHWSVSDPAVRDELNGYLVDHNGMARGYGMSSTTPGYVRVATYGQGAAQ